MRRWLSVAGGVGVIAFLVGLLGAYAALGAEFSLVSGVYKSEKNKTNGVSTWSQSAVQAGGRYAESLYSPLFWYAEGLLAMRNYSAGQGAVAPSNSMDLRGEAGVRMDFTNIGAVMPFGKIGGGLRDETTGVSPTGAGYIMTQDNGVFYTGAVGLRVEGGSDFFVDFETTLFESTLFGTETTETNPAPNSTITKQEKSKTELYVQSYEGVGKLKINVGMKF